MTDLPPPGWKPEKTPFEISMTKHLSSAVLKSPVDHEHFYGLVGQLIEAIGVLRSEVHELRKRPDLKYLKVWDATKVYGSGNFVTDGGSMWHADRASVGEKPGSGDAWTLAVKKGRDAR